MEKPEAGKIVVLTGAGVSAESGLGTFRDKGGAWTRYDLAEVATPEGFAADPVKVHDFYNARRVNAATAKPNAAHLALARLVADYPGPVVIVTQNVDDLHEQAGVRDVLHMHGRLDRAICAVCEADWEAPAKMRVEDPCPTCAARATRPDIVWFGEMPKYMEQIEAHLAEAAVFAAIGTSGTVYPAAGFVEIARIAGAATIELNLAASEISGRFDEVRIGPATGVVPVWVEEMLR